MRGFLILKRPACPGSLRQNVNVNRFFSSTPRYAAISLRKQKRGDPTKLPDTPCRTRFAPSPTGYLHLGSLRTALYNYLLAKATGGQFIMRIEDTDQQRLVHDAEKRLFEDLGWAGLTWDEGPDVEGPYGPYRQSERLALYDEHVDQLIQEDKAYRCFCSPEDLEHHKHAAHARGDPTHYPGTCRSVSQQESAHRAANGEAFAVRFKSAEKPMVIQDIVYGRYQKAEREEDFIIRKRDGFPTYHFANVVDDRLMKITHVIRGAEWLISTPKHAEMYAAFGWEPPAFAHVGLLVDKRRRKLSKRDYGVDMSWYKDMNVLPDTLLNFAVLLGWGRPGSAKNGDVMTLQEMVDNFAPKFSKGDIMVSLEKLNHLQTKHLRKLVDQKDPDMSKIKILSKAISEIMTRIAGLKNEAAEFRKLNPTEPNTTPKPASTTPTTTDPFTPPKPDETIPTDARIISTASSLPSFTELSLPGRHNSDSNPDLFASYIKDVLSATKLLPVPTPGSLVSFIVDNWFFFYDYPSSLIDAKMWDLAITSTIGQKNASAKMVNHLDKLISALRPVGADEWHVRGTLDPVVQGCVPPKKKVDEADAGGTDEIKFFYDLVRMALMGGAHGPSVADVARLLGREETLRRLGRARGVLRPTGGVDESGGGEGEGLKSS